MSKPKTEGQPKVLALGGGDGDGGGGGASACSLGWAELVCYDASCGCALAAR
jgi:hypothetical protein